MPLTIITNGHSRDLLWWYDLTAREQSNFDWIKAEEQEQYQSGGFCADVIP
jgi:hypothetical protein